MRSSSDHNPTEFCGSAVPHTAHNWSNPPELTLIYHCPGLPAITPGQAQSSHSISAHPQPSHRVRPIPHPDLASSTHRLIWCHSCNQQWWNDEDCLCVCERDDFDVEHEFEQVNWEILGAHELPIQELQTVDTARSRHPSRPSDQFSEMGPIPPITEQDVTEINRLQEIPDWANASRHGQMIIPSHSSEPTFSIISDWLHTNSLSIPYKESLAQLAEFGDGVWEVVDERTRIIVEGTTVIRIHEAKFGKVT